MTENKRYIRILDYSEKEVRIFDKNNQKNIFNIFFEGIDSAICLKGALEDTVDLLNESNDEKERWKSMSVATSNENGILWNEVHILMKQGAEPSDAFKKYLDSISTEHNKFWQRKLEKAKKDGVIE